MIAEPEEPRGQGAEEFTTPALIFGVTHEVPISSLVWDYETYAYPQYGDSGEALYRDLVNGDRAFMPICCPRPDGMLCVQGFIRRG
jgi:hypothetical protein